MEVLLINMNNDAFAVSLIAQYNLISLDSLHFFLPSFLNLNFNYRWNACR